MVLYTCKDRIEFFHLSIGLLVRVVGGSAVDPGSIPGSSCLRQKSVVGQEIANSAIVFMF